MIREVGTTVTRNGKQAALLVVEAPEARHRESILTLLAHKAREWQLHLTEALDGRTDDLETRWYVAELDGKLVSNAMTVERHGVGILGHVFTREDQRRQGLCRAVLTAMLRDFRERGGEALVLGTGYDSVPYHLYASLGFRSIRGGFMRYTARPPDAFDADWFEEGDAHIAPARWEHWPLVAMLGSRPAGHGLRSTAWGLSDLGNLEHPYCMFMSQVLHGEAAGMVAVTHRGAAVACATITPFAPGKGRDPWAGTWLVDAFAHSLHCYKLEAVIAALPRLAGKHVAIVPAADEIAVAAFVNNGFEREGMCRGLIGTQPQRGNACVLGREITA